VLSGLGVRAQAQPHGVSVNSGKARRFDPAGQGSAPLPDAVDVNVVRAGTPIPVEPVRAPPKQGSRPAAVAAQRMCQADCDLREPLP
jgi:hypothetical protein